MSEGQINIRCLSNLGRFPKWLYVILAAGTHIFFGEDLPLLCCFDFAGGERGVQKLLFGFVWVEINSARQMVLTQNHLGSRPGKPFGKWRARSKNTWQVIEQSVYHWVWPAEPAGEANSFQNQMGEEGRPSPSELFF